MNRNVWTKGLRAGVFGTLIAASAAAALTPDWAITLKAQDYAGYVDLRLDVAGGADGSRVYQASAGNELDVLVFLRNDGPADAHRPRLIASLQGAATPAGTSGCLEDPVGFPDCTLAQPLPAGASADYLMHFNVSPLARGSLYVAVAATSDDPEAAPGQELLQLQLPVAAHVDLNSAIRCNRAYQPANQPLSCQVTFRNDGPAATIVPYFDTFASFANTTLANCDASQPALCPPNLGAWNVPVMMPGEWVKLTFDVDMLQGIGVDDSTIYFGAAPTSSSEIENTPENNYGTLNLPVPLFRDGFEGDPPPLR